MKYSDMWTIDLLGRLEEKVLCSFEFSESSFSEEYEFDIFGTTLLFVRKCLKFIQVIIQSVPKLNTQDFVVLCVKFKKMSSSKVLSY